jgi:hypothetical protein
MEIGSPVRAVPLVYHQRPEKTGARRLQRLLQPRAGRRGRRINCLSYDY